MAGPQSPPLSGGSSYAAAPPSHRAVPSAQSSHDQLPSMHEQIQPSTRPQPSTGPILAWHWDVPEHERPWGNVLAAQLVPSEGLQPPASEATGHVG
jgi:hypothetical protein